MTFEDWLKEVDRFLYHIDDEDLEKLRHIQGFRGARRMGRAGDGPLQPGLLKGHP
jgi:hypothetical protein